MDDNLEIKLKREIVFEGNSEELYGIFADRFSTKEERDKYEYEIDAYTDNDTDSEARDIPIEDMKALIQKAEDAGANFISIDYHCDHEEYDIYGSKISRISDIDVIKEKKKQAIAEALKKKDKIRNLEDQIAELKK